MSNADPRVFARAFLAEHGLDSARRLADIAPSIGLSIVEIEADGFDGALVRAAGVACGEILLNRSIPSSRKLFTTAHELGHYVLPGHGTQPCRRADIEAFGSSGSAREQEANAFAAELTMPQEVVLPLAVRPPSFRTVEELAERCATSFSASAYRLVQSTTYALGMAWSEEGRVRWYKTSGEFDRKVRIEELDPRTVAADCFRGIDPPDQWVIVPAEAWLYPEGLRDGAVLKEWTRFFGRHRATLTLLFAENFLSEKHDFAGTDDETEADLDPEEFTLRRSRWPTK